LKRITAGIVAVAAIALVAVPVGAAAVSAPKKNIVQTAAAAPHFSTLVKLV
jgi:hypothetical protein